MPPPLPLRRGFGLSLLMVILLVGVAKTAFAGGAYDWAGTYLIGDPAAGTANWEVEIASSGYDVVSVKAWNWDASSGTWVLVVPVGYTGPAATVDMSAGGAFNLSALFYVLSGMTTPSFEIHIGTHSGDTIGPVFGGTMLAFGGDGSDTITAGGSFSYLFGNDGNDILDCATGGIA